MGKKKKNRLNSSQVTVSQTATTMVEEQPIRPIREFEIGVKGDEFDRKFTIAAKEKTAGADRLLRSLSRESISGGYDLLNFSVLITVILLISLSFALLSRDGFELPKLNSASLSNGSWSATLSKEYKDTLPLKRALKTAGAALGFCDPLEQELDTPEPDNADDLLVPDIPDITEPSEPAITSPPTSVESPKTVPVETEPPVTEPPETYIFYARSTVDVRLSPNHDSFIMGYFTVNEEINVVELMDDGWAKIWYNGSPAYVRSDSLAEETVATSRRRRSTTTEATEPEPETVPESEPEDTYIIESEPEVITEPEPETEPVSTTPDPAVLESIARAQASAAQGGQ